MILIVLGLSRAELGVELFQHVLAVPAACPSGVSRPVAPGGHHTTFSGSSRRS